MNIFIGNIKIEPRLTTISKNRVAIIVIRIISKIVAFFLRNPPKKPAAPNPIA